MTRHDDVPYSDPEPWSELIAECRCVEGECAAHGVSLRPHGHSAVGYHPAPMVIGESTRHLVDGYSDYGS